MSEKIIEDATVRNVVLARQKYPVEGVSKTTLRSGGGRRRYQLSGSKTCFAEYTRHGSACPGELRILREYSVLDAITINLIIHIPRVSFQAENAIKKSRHVENTEGTERS